MRTEKLKTDEPRGRVELFPPFENRKGWGSLNLEDGKEKSTGGWASPPRGRLQAYLARRYHDPFFTRYRSHPPPSSRVCRSVRRSGEIAMLNSQDSLSTRPTTFERLVARSNNFTVK